MGLRGADALVRGPVPRPAQTSLAQIFRNTNRSARGRQSQAWDPSHGVKIFGDSPTHDASKERS